MNKHSSIKKSLEKYSTNLDEETVNQLDNIRNKVLLSKIKTHWYQNLTWPMLGPAIAGMVLVVVLVLSNQSQNLDIQSESFLNDLDLLSQEVDAELLEDMEFIAWLETENLLEGELL